MEFTPVFYTDVLNECTQVIKKCLQDYQVSEIFLSFNGGKDCTVLLHATLKILRQLYGEDSIKDLRVIYIRTKSPFSELEKFITEAIEYYGLNLSIFTGSMQDALAQILSKDSRLKACLMGTRRTDPFSENLNHFQMTDENWPRIMRVSPVLNWNYQQIWSYLIENNVPYCSLYDQGYTSIGSTANTIPNPSLRYVDNNNVEKYKPAYCLKEDNMERNGRVYAINNTKYRTLT